MPQHRQGRKAIVATLGSSHGGEHVLGHRVTRRIASDDGQAFFDRKAAHAPDFTAGTASEVRRQPDIGQAVERAVGGRWLGMGDVEMGADPAGGQFGDQGGLVDQLAPGGVDEGRPVAHRGEERCVAHAVGRGDVGRVDADHIAEPGELGEVGDPFDAGR